MKTIIKITFLLITLNISAQEYSKKKIEIYVDSIIKMSVNLKDVNLSSDEIGNLIETPKETFWVNDNMTSNIFSKKKYFSDNDEHTLFQKIYRKGKTTDFLIMSKSEFPNIRFYGFWALLKNKNGKLAEKINELEKNKSKEIYLNSVGCEVESIESYELMNRFMKKIR